MNEQRPSVSDTPTRKARWMHAVLPVLCAVTVVLFGLWLLIAPQSTYSPEEKRTLTTSPDFSIRALLNGSYTATLGEFCADQFPLRSTFIDVKAMCERLLLRGENNDVLIGKDGYLISRQEYTDGQYAVLRENIELLRRIRKQANEREIPVVLATAPRSVDVNREQLPSHYDPSDADAVWTVWQKNAQDMQPVSLVESLRTAALSGEQVWYKTDHHWTAEGAYHAYAALGEVLGYEPYPQSDFFAQAVTDAFYGTTYATAGLRDTAPDTITLMRYEGDVQCRTIIHGAKERVLDGLYDMDAATSDDPYNVFLGGTNAHVTVEPATTGLPTLLIVKDSYAQSLAPFLSRHFRLILIDPRSFKPDAATTLWSIVEQEKPDAMLILCGIDTLCSDLNLRSLLIGATSKP